MREFTMLYVYYNPGMEEFYRSLQHEIKTSLTTISSMEDIERYEKLFLGRNGKIQVLFEQLVKLPPEQKRTWGQKINILKDETLQELDACRTTLTHKKPELLDVTIQKRAPHVTTSHPLSILMKEVEDIFTSMGFTVWDGPEVDTDYNNFEALNIPPHHPARDMQDTFYLEKNPYVLRTQTSNMQNRILKESSLPTRAIVPGRVFRHEATDASHEIAFHQVEGIMVDKFVSVAHMRYVMELFLQTLFHSKVHTRFRPGYFPFVEPGMELDFSCTVCEGKGCRLCKHSGWVEFMGCGMIHPNVLTEGGVDPEKYTGFAFGFGLTRLVLMRYKIDDIRLLHSSDLRFLEQFS